MVLEIAKYVSVKTVMDAILPLIPPRPRIEVVSYTEAYGRVAAGDVVAQEDVPPLPTSHMDGFAVDSGITRAATERSPVVLTLGGEIRLGERPTERLGPRQALRVSTGSFIPPGADAVVPLEQASVKGKRVMIRAPVPRGQLVFGAGEDVRKGATVIGGGKQIRAQDVGLAVALGIGSLAVYRRPKVAILATGNELTDSIEGGKGLVRNSHVPILTKLAEGCGCSVLNLGIAPDVPEEILSRIEDGLDKSDVVLTTGGTSVGILDFAEDVISSLKPSALFHGIRMDRGRVAGAAVVKRKPIVMMPGPIQGTVNAFLLLGLPMIRKISGRTEEELMVRARLRGRWEARRRFPNFTKVMYVRLSFGGPGPLAEPVTGETESMTTLTKSNAFVVVPEGTTSLKAGEEVDVILLPGFSFV